MNKLARNPGVVVFVGDLHQDCIPNTLAPTSSTDQPSLCISVYEYKVLNLDLCLTLDLAAMRVSYAVDLHDFSIILRIQSTHAKTRNVLKLM